MTKRWSYKIIGVDRIPQRDGHSNMSVEDTLRVYGESGWELVSVDNGKAYLKKRMGKLSKRHKIKKQ